VGTRRARAARAARAVSQIGIVCGVPLIRQLKHFFDFFQGSGIMSNSRVTVMSLTRRSVVTVTVITPGYKKNQRPRLWAVVSTLVAQAWGTSSTPPDIFIRRTISVNRRS